MLLHLVDGHQLACDGRHRKLGGVVDLAVQHAHAGRRGPHIVLDHLDGLFFLLLHVHLHLHILRGGGGLYGSRLLCRLWCGGNARCSGCRLWLGWLLWRLLWSTQRDGGRLGYQVALLLVHGLHLLLGFCLHLCCCLLLYFCILAGLVHGDDVLECQRGRQLFILIVVEFNHLYHHKIMPVNGLVRGALLLSLNLSILHLLLAHTLPL
mmetsp:Transcript_28026/g.75702  ORF Transcript_28026/g.75702 Transcript_28026/m.75702 type:complete len:208 (-) Transcript_28026:2158-2781(-)